jgi:alkanesulfonate monooxygenase SsuD/methylene tetrahydromethanopterin reductase-like flavin-dependent oxidoreductase (luciferase family)
VSADGGADAVTEFFLNLQIWGTPEQCYEKIVDVQKRIGGRTFNAICSYAGMPWDEAERNLRLFAESVRPELARFEL